MSHPSPSLWSPTPLLPSPALSARLGCRVFLKLENLHPSHSFKHRGISLLASRLLTNRPSAHLVIASSGNAGLALAYACRSLGARCTVCVPDGSAGVKGVLETYGGPGVRVEVGGKEYVDALNVAKGIVEGDKDAVLVSSYDDPVLWEGHSSVVHEIRDQLPPESSRPTAIFCSVGGGGLLGGVLKGCKDVGWDDVTVVANETHGSNCFHLSMLANPAFLASSSQSLPPFPEGVTTRATSEGVFVSRLPAITSRAESLGAREPSAEVVRMALERGGMRCVSAGDDLCLRACVGFADEHKFLVELACGAALASAYDKNVFDAILPLKEGEKLDERAVVFVVCGGAKVDSAVLESWRMEVREGKANDVKQVWVDATRFNY